MGKLFYIFLLLAAKFFICEADLWPQCEGNCTQSFPYCPDCALVDCLPTFSAEDCPSGTTFEENMIWGCCPACVKYLSEGSVCDESDYKLFSRYNHEMSCGLDKPERFKDMGNTNGIPVIERHVCAKDCDQNCNSRCEFRNDAVCSIAQKSYINWTLTADEHNCLEMDWEKSCLANGKFSPVQTKQNYIRNAEKKFCFDPAGNRISGISQVSDDTMNCMCSRKFWELKQEIHTVSNYLRARDNVTLHCQTNGNYEELQCDSGLCWCVNPDDGRVASVVVHEDLVKLLSCFDETSFGNSYLRRCESRRYGKVYSRNIFRIHGLNWQESVDVECDIDGSYEKIFCDKTTSSCSCVDKMKGLIQQYQAPLQDKELMDCRCARESLSGFSGILSCQDKYGGYREFQDLSEQIFCVDGDGFVKTSQYNKGCNIPNCAERSQMCNSSLTCTQCEPKCA